MTTIRSSARTPRLRLRNSRTLPLVAAPNPEIQVKSYRSVRWFLPGRFSRVGRCSGGSHQRKDNDIAYELLLRDRQLRLQISDCRRADLELDVVNAHQAWDQSGAEDVRR